MTAPKLTRITSEDAEQEEGRLFNDELAPLPHFPVSILTIHASSPDGYPITVTLNDPAKGALGKWIGLLKEQGFTPPAQVKPAGAATLGHASKTVEFSDDGTALCGNRNCSNYKKPLAKSTKNDGYFCRGKDEITGNQKGYCRTSVQ